MAVRIGYKASAEQFGPRELLEFSVDAERRGLELIATADHFQPWRHHGGHAPSALAWLGAIGQATHDAVIGTSVLTPTLRYHPSIVAQAFGTLGVLYPGRVFLGVGTGEAMNETPATDLEFPGRKERRQRLAEAVALIRKLWTEDRVDFEGQSTGPRRPRSTTAPRSRSRSTSPRPVRWRPSSPVVPATASSAPAARTRTSTSSCWTTCVEGAEAAGRDPTRSAA